MKNHYKGVERMLCFYFTIIKCVDFLVKYCSLYVLTKDFMKYIIVKFRSCPLYFPGIEFNLHVGFMP